VVEKKKFSIIGGDLRSVKLAEFIAAEGNSVNIYGFDKASFDITIKQSNTLEEAVNGSDVVIGPIPCSNDNEYINTPFHSEKILIHSVFKCMNKNQLFIAGRISDKIVHLAQVCNVYNVDMLDREEMAVLNAIPSALSKEQ
jgi:dipicolinate synthase subunit A